ncbi:protein asteroid homolog 1-like [Argonauta hians]
MGVSGLSTFVKSQNCFDTKYRLHDTKIVIDANNLYHFIYQHYKVPYRCGGDFHLFMAKIKMYFNVLQYCNISPYLVFDGGYETDDRKLKSCLAKARQRIHMSQSLARGGSGSVTPSLTSHTFRCAIKELGIPCVVGDFEADSQIMLLANQWNCPVLSNDSDFYIYDLTGGFISLDSVDYNPKTATGEDEPSGKPYKFLDCKFYHNQNFVDLFPGLNKSLLPLFSTLCGNDYVSSTGVFDKFFDNIKKAPDNFGRAIASRKNSAKFLSVLCWLHEQESLKDATANILKFYKTSDRQKLLTLIRRSISSYIDVVSCFDMKEFFEKDNLVFKPEGLKKFHAKCKVPEWFRHNLKRYQVPSSFVNAIRLRRMILMSQVEHMSYPSVYCCSTYIRQIIYGILLLDSIGNKSSEEIFIVEYDRVDCSYEKKKTRPIFTLPDFGPLPSLTDLASVSAELKREIMLHVFGTDLEFLEQFPEELKIVACGVVYWVKHANPKIHKAMVTALVVCNIYLWIKLSKDKNKENNLVCQSFAESDDSISKYFDNANREILNKIHKNLLKFCGNPSFDWKTKINTPVVHNFNQFQVTMRYVIELNQLLHEPFYGTSPCYIFCGTFLCNLFCEICQRANPQEFLSELLVPESLFESLFVSLDNAFHSLLKPFYGMERTSKKKSKKKRTKKKKEGSESGRTDETRTGNSNTSDDDVLDANIGTENRFNILA